MLDTSPETKAAAWLSSLSEALARKDVDAALALFCEDCYWRDFLALTWNIKTLEGKSAISAMLSATLGAANPTGFQVTEASATGSGNIEAWFTFSTTAGQGNGIFKLENGEGRTILTTLQSLAGHEERFGRTRPMGVRHGADRNRRTWTELRASEEAAYGNGGRPLLPGHWRRAGRHHARRASSPARCPDGDRREERARRRFLAQPLPLARAARPVWYDHLPYIPFPPNWPVFTPKDKMGDWLEMYVKVMELTYWTGTVCTSARFDPKEQRWTVELIRDGRPVTLRPTQLVFATGAYGPPSGSRCRRGDVCRRSHSFQPVFGRVEIQGQEGRRDRRREFRA